METVSALVVAPFPDFCPPETSEQLRNFVYHFYVLIKYEYCVLLAYKTSQNEVAEVLSLYSGHFRFLRQNFKNLTERCKENKTKQNKLLGDYIAKVGEILLLLTYSNICRITGIRT